MRHARDRRNLEIRRDDREGEEWKGRDGVLEKEIAASDRTIARAYLRALFLEEQAGEHMNRLTSADRKAKKATKALMGALREFHVALFGENFKENEDVILPARGSKIGELKLAPHRILDEKKEA